MTPTTCLVCGATETPGQDNTCPVCGAALPDPEATTATTPETADAGGAEPSWPSDAPAGAADAGPATDEERPDAPAPDPAPSAPTHSEPTDSEPTDSEPEPSEPAPSEPTAPEWPVAPGPGPSGAPAPEPEPTTVGAGTPPPPPPSGPSGPYGTAPAAPAAAAHPSGLPSQMRTYGMFTHLSAFASALVGLAFVGPLVMWLIRREEHPFLDHHGKEALNFNLSMLLYGVIGVVAVFATLGIGLVVVIPAAVVFFLTWVVATIVAAIRANAGEGFRYPLTIRFIADDV